MHCLEMAKTVWNAYIRGENAGHSQDRASAELRQISRQFLSLAMESLSLLEEDGDDGPIAESKLLDELLKHEM